MDHALYFWAPDVTDMWNTCVWMAISGKLAQVNFESYVDVAATASDGVTKESLNSLLYTVRLCMWLDEGVRIIKASD